MKLQRHSLDTTHALEGARHLEQENQRLAEEVALLRAHPDITPHPASLQIPELTLALRTLSESLKMLLLGNGRWRAPVWRSGRSSG